MRMCGVCKRPPREGEPMYCMRLYPEDIEGKEPGLYSACVECIDEHKPRVAIRMGIALENVQHEMLF